MTGLCVKRGAVNSVRPVWLLAVRWCSSLSFMSPSDVLFFKLKQHVGVCRICDPEETWQDARHWCFQPPRWCGWLTCLLHWSKCVYMHVSVREHMNVEISWEIHITQDVLYKYKIYVKCYDWTSGEENLFTRCCSVGTVTKAAVCSQWELLYNIKTKIKYK